MTTARLAIGVETTGPDPQNNDLLEFAAVLRRPCNGSTLYDTLRCRLFVPDEQMSGVLSRCHPTNRDRLLRHVRGQFADPTWFVPAATAASRLVNMVQAAGAPGTVPVVGFDAEKLALPFLARATVLPRTVVHHRTIQCGQLFMRPADPTMPDTQESCARALKAVADHVRSDMTRPCSSQARRLRAFIDSRAGANREVADRDAMDDAYAALDCYEIWEAVNS